MGGGWMARGGRGGGDIVDVVEETEISRKRWIFLFGFGISLGEVSWLFLGSFLALSWLFLGSFLALSWKFPRVFCNPTRIHHLEFPLARPTSIVKPDSLRFSTIPEDSSLFPPIASLFTKPTPMHTATIDYTKDSRMVDSDDDSDDEALLRPLFPLPIARKRPRTTLATGTISPTNTPPPRPRPTTRITTATTLRLHDEIQTRVSSTAPRKPYKVVEVVPSSPSDVLVLLDATVPPYVPGARCRVTREWLSRPQAECGWWTTTFTTLDNACSSAVVAAVTSTDAIQTLHATSRDAGVRVQRVQFGYGLVAAQPLPQGHLIPYGGRLTGVPRAQGEYNAEVAPGIYVVADTIDERGPGAYCNDSTVRPQSDSDLPYQMVSTHREANARLLCCEPYDGYVEEWGRGEHDGSEFAMYVEVVRPVQEGEEVTVAYGDGYWKGTRGEGGCYSDPVVMVE